MVSEYRQWHVAAAQIVGQLSLVIALPVLTRTVPPQEIGVYQSLLALSLIIQPIATLRIEFVIPALSTEGEYRRVRKIGLLALSTILTLFLVVAISAYIAERHDLVSHVSMCAILVLAYSWSVLDNAHAIRRNQRRRLALRNLFSGLFSAVFQITAAFLYPTALALACSILLGRGCAIVVSKLGDRRVESADFNLSPTSEWKFHRGFAAVLSGVASSGSAQSLILITGAVSGPLASANVGIARQVSIAPIGLISQALAQTAQLSIAPLIRTRDARAYQVVKKQVSRILPLALIAFIGLSTLGPLLAGPILGEQWTDAGKIIAFLALPSSLQLLFGPLMTIFTMLGREKLQLILQLARLAGSILAMLIMYLLLHDIIFAVVGYSIATSVWYFASYVLMLRELKKL